MVKVLFHQLGNHWLDAAGKIVFCTCVYIQTCRIHAFGHFFTILIIPPLFPFVSYKLLTICAHLGWEEGKELLE